MDERVEKISPESEVRLTSKVVVVMSRLGMETSPSVALIEVPRSPVSESGSAVVLGTSTVEVGTTLTAEEKTSLTVLSKSSVGPEIVRLVSIVVVTASRSDVRSAKPVVLMSRVVVVISGIAERLPSIEEMLSKAESKSIGRLVVT
jgi:hypothetical protein